MNTFKFQNSLLSIIILLAFSQCGDDSSQQNPIEKTFSLNSFLINNQSFQSTFTNVSLTPELRITFSEPINRESVQQEIIMGNSSAILVLNFSFINNDSTVIITPANKLNYLTSYNLSISPQLRAASNKTFDGDIFITINTTLDPTPKFPLLADEDTDNDNTNDLLSVIQQKTFNYFYNFAEPLSGMARERNTSGNLVTCGGSGFGIMALIVGMERNFITRQQGLDRMDKIVTFLEKADRFNGVWPHWMNGTTGKVIPFSPNDNGSDIVETSFMVEGLITFRQYLTTKSISDSYNLVNRINALWEEVNWDWHRKQADENVLYWHWSPDKTWTINMQIKGWNESLITYVLAASAPNEDFRIPKIVYDAGWASNGGMKNGNQYEGITLPLGPAWGGPLFFTHYSFLGLDPRGLSDEYVRDQPEGYWTQNVNHSRINYNYCVRNPRKYAGYGENCWGLTASDNNIGGYSAHSPTNDLGIITPTAALSSFPYTPVESMRAAKFFYYTLGDKLWGDYGFYDAFNLNQLWFANSYLAIDQGPIVVMIENYRTGLLWNLFMSAPEIQTGLTELGFTY